MGSDLKAMVSGAVLFHFSAADRFKHMLLVVARSNSFVGETTELDFDMTSLSGRLSTSNAHVRKGSGRIDE